MNNNKACLQKHWNALNDDQRSYIFSLIFSSYINCEININKVLTIQSGLYNSVWCLKENRFTALNMILYKYYLRNPETYYNSKILYYCFAIYSTRLHQ